jgi:hypothetical protein
MILEEIKSWTGILSDVISVLAIGAAAWWFLTTTKFKPRIQFDLDCNFLPLKENEDYFISELQFIFENKGFVEHRLYRLTVSVHALESEESLSEKEVTKELLFKKRLLSEVSLVPRKYGFYFVRPGVRQIITHTIKVPKSVSIIRVTAGFDYESSGKYPHTSRKVFKVGTP